MTRVRLIVLASVLTTGAFGQDTVFRSDVSLVRVDVQVLDRNRALTGLRATDFELRDDGRLQPIRNFSQEEMPVDLLFLIDVSVSMRPHVERLAAAAGTALNIMGDDDRVGIMVFDRSPRVRLQFRAVREDINREFDLLLRQESFDGGTDITRGLLEAARYVERSGRRDARRAIVILTDDQTERDRNDAAVLSALLRADAVLSALLAPDAMNSGFQRYPRGGGGSRNPGGQWPGAGGTLGGIILGRRGPQGWPGGGGGPQGPPISVGSRTRSAGTSEIAVESGGDSLTDDDASALEDTLGRIRQRYALYFNAPSDAREGQERTIDVALTSATLRRYPGAELRFRRTYRASSGSGTPVLSSEAGVPATDAPATVGAPTAGPAPAASAPAATPAKRGGWRRVDEPAPADHEPAPAKPIKRRN